MTSCIGQLCLLSVFTIIIKHCKSYTVNVTGVAQDNTKERDSDVQFTKVKYSTV